MRSNVADFLKMYNRVFALMPTLRTNLESQLCNNSMVSLLSGQRFETLKELLSWLESDDAEAFRKSFAIPLVTAMSHPQVVNKISSYLLSMASASNSTFASMLMQQLGVSSPEGLSSVLTNTVLPRVEAILGMDQQLEVPIGICPRCGELIPMG